MSMNTVDSKLAIFFGRSLSSIWRKAALFGAAYFFCAEAGSYLSAQDGTYVSFWLPAGLSVAVLLLNRTRDWPWLLLAVLPANYLFDFLHDQKPDLAVIFLFYVANVVQSATGAWLVRRFVAERPALMTLREFFGLVGFVAMFSTMLGAVIGAATLVHFGLSQSFEQSWKVWWGSTMMAVLVFTPFILAWFSKPDGTRNFFDRPAKIAEAALLFLGLTFFVSYLLAADKGVMSPNKSIIIPFLLWAGLRFGVRGATAASLFVSLLLAFFTAQFFFGLTPPQISSGEYVLVMQKALAVASLVALIPAIVVGERERTLAELRESEERFKNLVAAAFEGISISENGRILDMNEQGLKMFGYDRNEMIGKQIVELVAVESRPVVAEAVHAGQEVIYEHQLLRKDGSMFYAEAQARMVRIGKRTFRMTALRDITDRKRAEAERAETLARETQTRMEYTFQIIALQEAERERIARELHDSLGQNLLLIKNRAQLEMNKAKLPRDLQEEFKNISNLASQAIAEVRQISHDLHPHQLGLLGLTRALRALVDNTDESIAIAIGGKFDSVDDIFPREAATNVYRIVQESLSNILKHSHAKNARITLERDVHEVLLKIEDDGCGFKAGENGKGLGLKNIVERVRMLGGKIKVESQPEKGTRIEITIPISAEQR
jgi:PAS domain S-box-containing protein